jgi:hypothetical protein
LRAYDLLWTEPGETPLLEELEVQKGEIDALTALRHMLDYPYIRGFIALGLRNDDPVVQYRGHNIYNPKATVWVGALSGDGDVLDGIKCIGAHAALVYLTQDEYRATAGTGVKLRVVQT